MTPIYLKSSSNDQYVEHQFLSPRDHHSNENQLLSPNSQASSSSTDSLITCHLSLNPSTTGHDQDGSTLNRESHPSQDKEGDNNFGSQSYCDDHRVESHDDEMRGRSNINNNGLKFSLWKNKESYDDDDHMMINDESQVKWMSSKMRVMFRMRKTNPTKVVNALPPPPTASGELIRHKEPPSSSSPMGEITANSNSINNSINCYNNIPIRSCSDCNTTKTPLWRSGPQGPKSLCNACGIRQRKARKAMALATAAESVAAETSKNVFSSSTDMPTSLKATKILHKDHKKTNNNNRHNNAAAKFKKTQYYASKQIINKTNRPHLQSSSSSSPSARKNRVEDFLVSLRKNLAFHGVFPHDEKEAAILLMALSCGYAHR